MVSPITYGDHNKQRGSHRLSELERAVDGGLRQSRRSVDVTRRSHRQCLCNTFKGLAEPSGRRRPPNSLTDHRVKFFSQHSEINTACLLSTQKYSSNPFQSTTKLECGPMPNLMVALPKIAGALCSTPQSLADAHY